MPLRLLALPLAAALAPLTLRAQTSSYSLVLTHTGADTIAIERVSRSAARLEGDLVVRSGGVRVVYRADLDAEGDVTRFVLTQRRASDASDATPQFSGDITFVDDSAFAHVSTAGGAPQEQRFTVARGAIPYFSPSFALVELAIARARARGGASVEVPMMNINNAHPFQAKVVSVGADSVTVTMGTALARLAVEADGRIRGGAIPDQGLVVTRGAAMTAESMRTEKPDYSAPAGVPYTATEVVVPTARGYTLAGTLTMPRDVRGAVPAVVTITGSGPEDRDEAIPPVKGYRPFREIADSLARRGIAVLRMDDRGTGGSGGNFLEATSDDFAQDIESGLAYLRSRGDIDGARLALVGHSEGGLIAPIVAARDARVRAIALMAGPGYTGRRILEFQNRYALDHNPKLTPAARDSLMRHVVPHALDSLDRSNRWMHFFFTHDPVVTARQVRQPVLILQGQTDQQVTPEQADTLAAAFRAGGNRSVTVKRFADANHLFLHDPSGDPGGYTTLGDHALRRDVLGTLVDWLVTQLR